MSPPGQLQVANARSPIATSHWFRQCRSLWLLLDTMEKHSIWQMI
jgi:hypothetical protein